MQACMTPLGNSKVESQDKTHGNSTSFLVDLLEFPHALSPIPLETPYPHPPVFFWNSLLYGFAIMTWQPWKLFNFSAIITDELHCSKTRVQRVPSRTKGQEDIF